MTCIWGSSSTHHQAAGSVIRSAVTALGVILGALGFFCLVYLPPQKLEDALLAIGVDPLGASPELTVKERTLRFDGMITAGSADKFAALVNEHPEVDQVSLSSLGGRIDEAVKIASLIKLRNLSTVAVGECSSACTIIFLSSKVRMFGADAALGFHSPSGGGAGDVVVNGASLETRLAYVDAGLSEPFADKAFGTPSNSMWYPIDYVLIREGAVNMFTKARIRQDHEQSIQSFNETKPLKIDEFMSVVSAKAYDTDITYTYVISAEKDEIDWAAMSKQAAYDADELICGDAVSNIMVKSGATYSYLYVDKNGRKVGAATVGECHSGSW